MAEEIVKEGAVSVEESEYSITSFTLVREEKIEYLHGLLNKVFKILHLIEEEKDTGFSPKPFIAGQLFEIHSANLLFDNKLTVVMVKLRGLYDQYDKIPFPECKKQIFEIQKIIKSALKKMESGNDL